MHEMSLAMEICRIAEQAVGPERARHVREVAVEVGQDANVEPESLAFCLEVLLAQPPFGRARPALTHPPGDVLRVTHLEVEDGGPDD